MTSPEIAHAAFVESLLEDLDLADTSDLRFMIDQTMQDDEQAPPEKLQVGEDALRAFLEYGRVMTYLVGDDDDARMPILMGLLVGYALRKSQE